jgi:peptide/nickel transport system permease protein
MNGALRRLGVSAFGVFLSSVFVFAVLRVLPGDIATSRLGINATPEALARLRAELGLDRPLIRQYAEWIIDALRGDLGTSLVDGGSVSSSIISRLDVSIPLIAAASVLSIAIATWLGQRAALQRRSVVGVSLSMFSQLGLAIPTFVVGVGLVAVFSVQWRLLPAGGFPTEGWANPAEAIRSMVLPTLTLTLTQTAMLFRFARSQALDVLASDSYRTARAVGLRRTDALSTARRLIVSPVLNVNALQISSFLTTAVVAESVFALPGLGTMLVRDIANRDVTKVQSTLLVVVLVVFAIRLVIEATNVRLDPRRST